MIETRLLRNALMLAEHRNFARAAIVLNISQPTLTRSIQLLEKEGLTISDLSQFPLILTALPKRLSDLFDRLFFPDGDAGSSTRKLENITSNDLATIKATVSQSDSISIGTYGALASELEAGLLVALPFRIPELESYYDIVKRKGLSLSPAARAFIEILIETDQEQSILEVDLIDSLGPAITSQGLR